MGAMKIGLMLPLGADETGGFANLRAMAVAAEGSGLDSVWGADHLIFRDGEETAGIHECWTVLSAVAAVTSRVEIGPLVLALPFRNPALTAKMAAELDEVSGGRLILGLGCGWHEPEFDAFGYPFDHRVGRFEEGVRIIGPLLRGESVTFEGRWHQRRERRAHPAPRARRRAADPDRRQAAAHAADRGRACRPVERRLVRLSRRGRRAANTPGERRPARWRRPAATRRR